jgi:peptidoglycan/LPS O-acetylase OafA/YrhL
LTAAAAPRWRQNNFDALRFAAAALVIFSHSFVLTGATFEPLAWATNGFETLGGLGVAIFFVMSGFLITESWERDPRPRVFFTKRLLRIWPALAAAILLAVFVLGPLASSLGPGRFLSEPASWDYLWGLSILRVRYFLPGVFEGNPVARAVNGSLWTIPLEFGCYCAVAALGWLGRSPRRWVALVMAVGLLYLDWSPFGAGLGHPLNGALIRSYARYASYFFAGVFLCLMPLLIPRSRAGVLAAAIALLFCARTACAPPVAHLTLPILVLAGASAPVPVLQGFGRYGDFSYGMYVYAFPIQQWMVIALPSARSPIGLFASSFPVIVAAAAMSWHFLEAPALRFKARLVRPVDSSTGG